jgi:hypothetical protein
VVADQVLQLQANGLVEIVCKRQMDCPHGTSCRFGHCKNESSRRLGNHGR